MIIIIIKEKEEENKDFVSKAPKERPPPSMSAMYELMSSAHLFLISQIGSLSSSTTTTD